MRLVRIVGLLMGLVLLTSPLLAQERSVPPLTGAVYSSANDIFIRHPEDWRGFEDDTGMLHITTPAQFGNLYGEDNFLDEGQAVLSIRVRRFADNPRIPPNESSVVAAARLVPGTSARAAYIPTLANFTRYRGGELNAPFLPNTRQYILFLDETRFADVLINAAPGSFDAYLPTMEAMIETLTLSSSRPADMRSAFRGSLYFPQGFAPTNGTRLFDSAFGNLFIDVPRTWTFNEFSRESFSLTNTSQRAEFYLFPGEFFVSARFEPIPQDAVKTSRSLLYESLPGAEQRVLSVDEFTWNGVPIARAVISDDTFYLTRLLLEPPRPDEDQRDDPRQLTHYITLFVKVGDGALQQVEGNILNFLTSAYMENEQFTTFETREYTANLTELTPSPFISARADLATNHPPGWFMNDTTSSIIARTTSTPLEAGFGIFEQSNPFESALVQLTIESYQARGLDPDIRINELPATTGDANISEITVIDFNERQAVMYATDFDFRTLIMPINRSEFVQARVRAEFETYTQREREILAMMAHMERRLLGNGDGSYFSAAGRRTFTARSQKIQLDVPADWYTAEFSDGAASSAILGIPARADVPLIGDVASPQFQENAAALVTITYDDPPTFVVVNDEGNVEVFSQNLFDYMQATVGNTTILPERLTVAGYPALRRIENGTGFLLIQRNDGSIVRVFIQNLTGDPATLNYDFGFESRLYPVLDTLEYPPADATEPTEFYANRGKNILIQYPYDWTIREESYEVQVGEGENATTRTETIVRFSNVLDYRGEPGQVQISVQVEPQEPDRRYNLDRGGTLANIQILEAVRGATVSGTIETNGAIFTGETTSPYRFLVFDLQVGARDDLERFYPTFVKMINSLEITVIPAGEGAAEVEVGATEEAGS
ncbi:MAG: hypothetical protein AAFR56_04875 [Chloroflexota bacterium]